MQRVEFQVMRLRRYHGDAAFEVYGDLGSGSVDLDRPFPPGRVRMWPEAAARRGHLLDGHVALRHLDSADPDGHVETLHLLGEHLYPAWPVRCESPGYVFGRFQHAVRVFDGVGNVDLYSQAEFVTTISTSPTVPRRCRRSSYDSQADRVEIAFEPSRFAPIVGN